jgi:hypothetical protein
MMSLHARPVAFLATVLVLAGCAVPSATDGSGPGSSAATPSALPDATVHVYVLRLRVTQETVTGPAMPGAEVYVVPEASTTGDPAKLPFPQLANAAGEIEVRFPDPTTVLVQAVASGKGWTREGMRIQLGDAVVVDGVTLPSPAPGEVPVVVLPLLRSEVPFTLQATWSTTIATPAAGETTGTAFVLTDLGLPKDDAIRTLYLQRLRSARLDVSWTNDAGHLADVVPGLSWDGATVWVEGADDSVDLTPGTHAATFDAALPEDRPATAVLTLQGAIITHRAVVGDVAFNMEGLLRFGGHAPAGLPPPPCLPLALC